METNITFTPDFNQQLIIGGILFVLIALFFKYSGFFGDSTSKKKNKIYFYKVSWDNTIQNTTEERYIMMSEPMIIETPVILKQKITKDREPGIIKNYNIQAFTLINKGIYEPETNESLKYNEVYFF